MTPGARISAAIEILNAAFAGAPAEKVLTSWGRANRYAGSKDRAAIRDHVFDALRCKRSFGVLGGGTDGRALMIGMLRDQSIDPASLFTGDGYCPPPLTDAEIAAGATPDGADALDVPDWLYADLQVALGDETDQILTAFRHRAPVFLRVNLSKTTRDAAQATLADQGIVTQPVDLSPTALRVLPGSAKIAPSQAYLDGLIELQDAASQAVCDAVPLQNMTRILDFCAGGGGKSLALAGRHSAQYHATDAIPTRTKDLPARAERAGTPITVLPMVKLSGPYDVVLTDVPCSGTGSWRRQPEAKWSLTDNRLKELTETQVKILDQARNLVSETGALVYLTCSLLRAENENIVDAFCEKHADWHCVKQQRFGPVNDSDGLFFAHFARKS
jgi:16S rRNA (cytosine967-C5)-methyltransferase